MEAVTLTPFRASIILLSCFGTDRRTKGKENSGITWPISFKKIKLVGPILLLTVNTRLGPKQALFS